MDRIMLAAATGMALVFATGVVAGIVLMVAMAIRRQDNVAPEAAHKAGKDQTP